MIPRRFSEFSGHVSVFTIAYLHGGMEGSTRITEGASINEDEMPNVDLALFIDARTNDERYGRIC